MMAWSHYPDSLVTVFVLLVTLLAEVSEVAMLSSAFSFVLFFSRCFMGASFNVRKRGGYFSNREEKNLSIIQRWVLNSEGSICFSTI